MPTATMPRRASLWLRNILKPSSISLKPRPSFEISFSWGPISNFPNLTVASAAKVNPRAAIKITIASATSALFDLVIKFFTAIPNPPPITTKIVPPVTASALAAINSSFFTNNGRPADKPAKINRLTPKAINTKKVSSNPVAPLLTR